jgi:glycosyltransferase involved in cell wall biosynthesis
MRFLLIYSTTGVIGGVETLLARMSRWLIENGHQVTLLAEQPGKWTELLPCGMKVIILNKQFPKLYYYFHAKRLWNSLGIEKPDVIKSFDMSSSWIACQLAGIMRNNCKVVAGIYNPLIFRWYWSPDAALPWSVKGLYLRNYLKCVPASARIFCGVDQVEELEEVHHQRGLLWPIPIDTTQFLPASRKPRWGKIVSIGRLSPMKDYNFYMCDVVTALRGKGYDVTWSVYGTGEYENQMRERIEQLGLQQVISLKGAVPYNRFWSVLEDAYVFIGMGTAILEAALFKVPNVNALAYDREGITHGPVYRFPRGSIGPSIASPPLLKVVNEIERILRLNRTEYEAEAELVYAHMQDHVVDNSMHRFLKLVQEADPIQSPKLLYLTNYPLWLLRRLMKSLVRPRETVHPTFERQEAPART